MAFDTGLTTTKNQFPCQAPVACLVPDPPSPHLLILPCPLPALPWVTGTQLRYPHHYTAHSNPPNLVSTVHLSDWGRRGE